MYNAIQKPENTEKSNLLTIKLELSYIIGKYVTDMSNIHNDMFWQHPQANPHLK